MPTAPEQELPGLHPLKNKSFEACSDKVLEKAKRVLRLRPQGGGWRAQAGKRPGARQSPGSPVRAGVIAGLVGLGRAPEEAAPGPEAAPGARGEARRARARAKARGTAAVPMLPA